MMYDFDPGQIEGWANRQDARGVFPVLVRRLLKATLSGFNYSLEMPGGSSVDDPGWDGMLRVGRGNRWAPDGVSGWEFSCGKDVVSKANKNYKSRTDCSLGIKKESSTFVFFAPRKWRGKKAWKEERCGEGKWLDVRAYDVDDLVSWLEESEEVSEWFWGVLNNTTTIVQVSEKLDFISDLVEKRFGGQVKQPDSAPIQGPEHEEVLGIIKLASQFLQKGHVITARTELKKVEGEVAKLPDAVRFRFLTTLAGCKISEDKDSEAADLIMEAHRVQPEHPAGITNASLAARIQQDYGQAYDYARKSLRINPHDSVAAANLITSLWELGNVDQMEEYVRSEEWLASEPESAIALARIRTQQGRGEEAEFLYRSLVEADSDDHEAYTGLSQCLVARAQEDRALVFHSSELAEVLREAESMASKAVDFLRNTQLVARRKEALLLRAYSRMRLEKTDESMHDVTSVLDELPDSSNAIHLKGILLLKMREFEKASQTLRRIQDAETQEDALLPLADAHLELGEATTAVCILRDSFSLDPPGLEDLGRAQSLLKAEDKVGGEDTVGPMIDAALSRFPRDPILFTLSAIRHSIQGNAEAAKFALIEAIELSSDSFERMLRSQLGDFYVNAGQDAEAAEQFGKVCGDDITHPDAVLLLLSLSNSGQYQKAFEVTKRFREEPSVSPRIVLSVEAEILGYVGDVKAAALCLQELCSRTDAKVEDRVELAKVQFRCGEHAPALKTIGEIEVSKLKHNPRFVMDLAKLKRALGVSDFINDAYFSLRLGGVDDPSIQKDYLSLFLSLGEEWEEPQEVNPGCSVRIQMNRADGWWHIIEWDESPLNDQELSPDNGFAQQLMGKKVGEAFDFQQGTEVRVCKIVELQSRYVRVSQEIPEKFSVRFPDDPSLSYFNIDNFLETVLHNIDMRHRQVESAEKAYESRQIPFTIFSRLIGSSMPMLWFEYVKKPDKKLWFGESSLQEKNQGSELFQDADKIILDFVALLTVHRLRLSSFLRSRFSNVCISQFVFEEIQDEALRTNQTPAPGGLMGKDEEGRYVMNEMPDEEWEEWKSFLTSLYELARTLERVPAYPILSLPEPPMAYGVFGPSGAGTVFLGNEEDEANSAWVFDDLMLSQLAEAQNIRSVNSQALLEELLRTKIITKKTYSSKIEELMLMDYWFVRVSAEDVVQNLDSSSYRITSGIKALLETLRGPTRSENSAADLAAEIVGSVAKRTMPDSQFELVLTLVLTEMRSGRPSDEVIIRFMRNISSLLELHPLRLLQTLQVSRSFMQALRL